MLSQQCMFPACYSCLSNVIYSFIVPGSLQELGLACMDSDPESRPNFATVLKMLDQVPC